MRLRPFLDRYGPALVVVAVLTLLVALLPGNVEEQPVGAGNDTDVNVPFGGDAAGADGAAAAGADGAATPGGTAAVGGSRRSGTGTAGSGRQAGGQGGPPPDVRFGSGPNCGADGRQKAFALHAPPCVDWAPGTPNGGRTARGVTEDSILVIRYVNQQNPATKAALAAAGADDTEADVARMFEALRHYFNNHFETYGREVVVKTMQATGPNDNEEAMRSDAITIAEKEGAFAVFTDGFGPPVLARELAQRGVICLCTVSESTTFYQASPPLIFSPSPTAEEYYGHVAEYAGKRLAGRKAVHGGSADITTRDRRFGLIWVEGPDGAASPGSKAARDYFVRELGRYGVRLAAEFSYLVDFASSGEQAAAAIAKMIDNDVTTMILHVDPLFPVFLTREATRQTYFPEWMVSAQALTGSTFFGRQYDQLQWRHAFGISPIALSAPQFSQDHAYRAYHHARPQDQDGDEGISIRVMYNEMELLWRGIHMAGPGLTPESFAQGMFRYPKTGGTPASPLHYHTRELPTATKDFNEVWWDPDRRGEDEIGNDGLGVMMKSDGGRRYVLGTWPSTDPKLFDPAGAVVVADQPTGGPPQWEHDKDGHVHTKRCQSCRR